MQSNNAPQWSKLRRHTRMLILNSLRPLKYWLLARCSVHQTIRETIASIRLFTLIAMTLLLYPTMVCSAGNQRQLDFYHTHTKEYLSIVYHDGEKYILSSLEQIGRFLGDFRNGKIHPIDPAVLDILFKLRTRLGGEGTFEIISGYRSPETNAMLRKNGQSVAKRSLHMKGKAINVRLRGVDSARLYKAAIDLQVGGVGFYPISDFAHVDSGRVRTW